MGPPVFLQPAYVDMAHNDSAGALVASLAVTLTANMLPGHLLLATIQIIGTNPTFATPAGWTVTGLAQGSAATYYRFMQPGDTSVTFTWGAGVTRNSSALVMAFANVNSASPFGGTSQNNVSTSSTTRNSVSLTTTVPGCLFVIQVGSNTTPPITHTEQASLTEVWDQNQSGSTAAPSLMGCYEKTLLGAAGTEAARTVTASATSSGRTNAFALAPAPIRASMNVGQAVNRASYF